MRQDPAGVSDSKRAAPSAPMDKEFIVGIMRPKQDLQICCKEVLFARGLYDTRNSSLSLWENIFVKLFLIPPLLLDSPEAKASVLDPLNMFSPHWLDSQGDLTLGA